MKRTFSSLIWDIPSLFHLTLCLYSKQKLKVYIYASIYIHHRMYIVIIIFYLNDARIALNASTSVRLLSSRCVYLIDASLHLLRRLFHYVQILFTRRIESGKKMNTIKQSRKKNKVIVKKLIDRFFFERFEKQKWLHTRTINDLWITECESSGGTYTFMMN